jgi:hypothetical protein
LGWLLLIFERDEQENPILRKIHNVAILRHRYSCRAHSSPLSSPIGAARVAIQTRHRRAFSYCNALSPTI